MKRVTLIISDLHMGDGKAGDDFVDDKHQFAAFIHQQLATPEGAEGQIELIINGDFIEFVQVAPEVYRCETLDFWCTEQESRLKLKAVIDGHPEVFQALRDFQDKGNQVTLFAGNHDVDLYWDGVQEDIRAAAGKETNIELRQVWFSRYDGKLQISHGHLFEEVDPANMFQHWDEPRLGQPDSLVQRLEICPGTIFVVRFVNLLEAKYPFADNLHPETAIVNVLWREDKWALRAVAWAFGRFMRQFPKAFLSSNSSTTAIEEVGPQLLTSIQVDDLLQNKIAELYREALGEPEMTGPAVAARLTTEDAIEEFIARLMASNLPWERWTDVLALAQPATSSLGSGDGSTLSIVAAGQIDTRQACLAVARRAWADGAQVVVLGHTHLPQDISENGKSYYNPGSWTRYVDTADVSSLTLEKLEREADFPYQLNYVRVEQTAAGTLVSSMHTL